MERNASKSVPLDHLIKRGGGPRQLARGLGISSSAITQWPQVPIRRAVDVARLTGTPVDQIRPDIWSDDALREARSAHRREEVG